MGFRGDSKRNAKQQEGPGFIGDQREKSRAKPSMVGHWGSVRKKDLTGAVEERYGSSLGEVEDTGEGHIK